MGCQVQRCRKSEKTNLSTCTRPRGVNCGPFPGVCVTFCVTFARFSVCSNCVDPHSKGFSAGEENRTGTGIHPKSRGIAVARNGGGLV